MKNLTANDTLDFNAVEWTLYELDHLREDQELLRQAKSCFDLERKAFEEVASRFKSNPEARREVSSEALEALLLSGSDRSDIRTDPTITNYFIFHTEGYETSILNKDIIVQRSKVDHIISRKVKAIFKGSDLTIQNSGLLFYPPGGYIGWHTNSRVPGWRLYINYVEEPGKSFFRYWDSEAKEIITRWDTGYDFRLFKVDQKKLFWHAVYSDTYRYSIGYRIVGPSEPSLLNQIGRFFKISPSKGSGME